MAQHIWKENEEKTSEEDLAITEHRDRDVASTAVPNTANEPAVETTAETPQEALDELGEDVASSPAERGHVPRETEETSRNDGGPT